MNLTQLLAKESYLLGGLKDQVKILDVVPNNIN